MDRKIGEIMIYSKPITEIIQNRFSCRTYIEEAIAPEKQLMLRNYMSNLQTGPLGAPLRFDLLAASDKDRSALRGLGTYGTIKGPSGFIVGAMCPGARNLEDYGYRLEQIILYLTDLGIGTCWLGGFFTRSSFAKRISLSAQERIPAVVSIGTIADEAQARQASFRQRIGSDSRLPWETLFFDGKFGLSLTREKAGAYAVPLENVRLGPSASNKQPWRVIQAGNAFHFYLQRTQGYPPDVVVKLMRLEDLQRVDLGIAMCHFELTANELGLKGHWIVQEPAIDKPDETCEYSITWVKDDIVR
jgi:hypothetical protein